MSLIKQLWLGIFILVTLTFSTSVLVATFQSRDSYQEQLQLKNIDNATNLALLLSHSEKELTQLELLLAAQFDSGHYQYISLTTADNQSLIRFDADATVHRAPTWFKRLLNLQLNPGVAQVQDGWMQFGTLTLQSQYDYAIDALWLTTLALARWSFWVALVFGVLASFALRFISKPLESVVQQAEALGQRRFISSKEPATLEFRRVVKAMNILTGRVKAMLENELQRAAELQEKSQRDPLLPCFNRGYMRSWLTSHYAAITDAEQRIAVLFRISNLANINVLLGREKTDALLTDLIQVFTTKHKESVVGRLNGSDFLAILPFDDKSEEAFEALYHSLETTLFAVVDKPHAQLSCVAIELVAANNTEACLSQLDTLLSDLAVTTLSGCKMQQISVLNVHGSNYWREILPSLLDKPYTLPRAFPVVSRQATLMHYKLFLQLDVQGELLAASHVIGWIKRFGWISKVDLLMCKTAIQYLANNDGVAFALSEAVFTDENHFYQLLSMLKHVTPAMREKLVIEFSESVALEHQLVLKRIVAACKQLGIKVGLVNCGHGLNQFNALESLALDYLKVDAALIGQYQDSEVQRLFTSIIQLGKALGAHVIADGVHSEHALHSLLPLGFDAVAGAAVEYQPKA